MTIRKYIANTEEEATKLAKEELGEDVVIMNVKTVNAKGIMKWFKKPTVELTAAVDEVKRESSPQTTQQPKSPKQEVFPDFQKLQEAIQETNAVLAAEEAKKENKTSLEKKDIAKSIEKSNQILSENSEKIFSGGEKEEATKEDKIEDRLSNLQDLLEKQMKNKEKEEVDKKKEEKEQNQPYYDMIRKKLIDNEVEENYVEQLLDDISENLGNKANLDSILAAIYQKIVLKIGQPHLIDIKSQKTKYIFFVGPTGVGKTTTIAKIASTLKLTKKTKVALITSDTYRIAAVEQLRTYANILGIPLHVVYSADDMKSAKEELKDFDLVFVDTAGRSHNNVEQKEDIQKLLDTIEDEQKEVFLVLSATTKYKDLVKISTTYSEITKYNLIFTKLDETDTIGNIFNIHMLTEAPLSYTTYGQNVPDDIGKIDAQSIAKQLLGGNG